MSEERELDARNHPLWPWFQAAALRIGFSTEHATIWPRYWEVFLAGAQSSREFMANEKLG